MQVLLELNVYPVAQAVQVLAVVAQVWQFAGDVHWIQVLLELKVYPVAQAVQVLAVVAQVWQLAGDVH